MPEEHRPPTELQFERADFIAPAALTCVTCKLPIGDEYFEINAHVVCPLCRDRLLAARAQGSSGGRFLRAFFFGLGAAAAGAVLWYTVREITQLEIGLIAIVLGIFVGSAIRRGAQGRGGLPYQILAVMLTYLAIVSANAPYVLSGVRKSIAHDLETLQKQYADAPPPPVGSKPLPTVDQAIAQLGTRAWLKISWWILASPFLAGIQNFLGWLIIFFGLQQAWRLARAAPFQVTGPFRLSASAAPA